MSRFGRALGSGIAKGLCDLDRSLSAPEEAYWEREQRIMKECERKNREQEKRDAAYKRAFGVWPSDTCRFRQ
jgi:hypothetical protein